MARKSPIIWTRSTWWCDTQFIVIEALTPHCGLLSGGGNICFCLTSYDVIVWVCEVALVMSYFGYRSMRSLGPWFGFMTFLVLVGGMSRFKRRSIVGWCPNTERWGVGRVFRSSNWKRGNSTSFLLSLWVVTIVENLSFQYVNSINWICKWGIGTKWWIIFKGCEV